MALFEIATFGSFARLLLAARKLAEDPDPLNRLKALADLAENGAKLRAALEDRKLGPLAGRIEAACQGADAAFAREPGHADAQLVFRDAAAVALTRCDALAAHDLEPTAILRDMIDAIEASDHARDFREADLSEAYFRAVMEAALAEMLADGAFIDGLSPQLWRESLRRQRVTVELLAEVREQQEREAAQAEERHEELLANFRATDQAMRLAKAGVSEEALIALADRIADDVADLNQAWTELQSAIEIAIRVQEEGRQGSNLGEFVDAVLQRVAGLSAKGDHDDAATEIDAALEAEEAEFKARKLRLLESGLEQDRLRRNPPAAARRALRLAETEADGALNFGALRALQTEWRERGRDRGLQFDQEVSVALARVACERAADANERCTALMDLGASLGEIGEREPGRARLEQAVAAFREALAECPRELAPLDWGRAQVNMANALQRLGEREAGLERMEEAAAAYRAALKELTRDRVPQDWATTQLNLGHVLRSIGLREAGTVRLEDAVAACRAALEVLTRDRTPQDWASAQLNLANALQSLGQRVAGTQRLEEAVSACRAALEVRTRDRVPLDWAMTQANLGDALQSLGQREPGTARLEKAVTAYREALKEWTRDRVPLDWASTQNSLGSALRELGLRQGSAQCLEAATDAFRAANWELSRDRAPVKWAYLQGNLALVDLAYFEMTGDAARLDGAEALLRAAREVFAEAQAGQHLGWADHLLAGIAQRR